MKKYIKLLSLALILSGLIFLYFAISSLNQKIIPTVPRPEVLIRSIDTMKYSRDLAREKENDASFDLVIKKQVTDIAETGANYIAIGTPYDKEFVPFLKKWVKAARENNLKVWFRGNMSGWEEWFGYPSIDRETHTKLIVEFIKTNVGLFDTGDIFTPCSECENGGPGDPRNTGNVEEYRIFLINEYTAAQKAFRDINKKVLTGFFSMNYDVATLIMDKATTESLGGVVVIDHYTSSPTQLAYDAKILAQKSGGKIVFGELGAPIPDLNGNMTEDEQADWIDKAFVGIFNSLDIVGINYWVGFGGSTQLWDENGKPKKAVEIIKKYYKINYQNQ